MAFDPTSIVFNYNDRLWTTLELSDQITQKEFVVALSNCDNDDLINEAIDNYPGVLTVFIEKICFYGSLKMLQIAIFCRDISVSYAGSLVNAISSRDDDNVEMLCYVMERFNIQFDNYYYTIIYYAAVKDNVKIIQLIIGFIKDKITSIYYLKNAFCNIVINKSINVWRLLCESGYMTDLLSDEKVIRIIYDRMGHTGKNREMMEILVEHYNSGQITGADYYIEHWIKKFDLLTA
jgi:hypothetical protein